MSNDKNVKGNKDKGAVVDINNDQQDYDKQHDSGDSGVVVMVNGKPQLANRNAIRTVPTKAELDAKEKEEEGQMTVRVTMLPDELDPFSEEKEIKVVRKKKPKEITRVDITSEQTETVEPLKPIEAKKKIGRPRKS